MTSSGGGAFRVAYLETHKKGALVAKVEEAVGILAGCILCPRACDVDRLNGERGVCLAGREAEVSSFGPHYGEESPLVGTHGSGTIFLTHCNLRCVFCQNHSISHGGEGRTVPAERLAGMMVELQARGCHNINFVTPTHFVPQILTALPLAVEKGLRVPLVYNTGGYDSLRTVKLLDGVFDIYMPDLKFTDSGPAEEFCKAADYPETVEAAILEMHRQVGDLILDENGIAQRGLLVRHLVLPGGLAGTKKAMKFLAGRVSKNTYVNIMDQYHPFGDIPPRSPLRRRTSREEYEDALRTAGEEGLHRIDKKERRRPLWGL